MGLIRGARVAGSGFQRMFGHEVRIIATSYRRYRPEPREAEVLCGIFGHLGETIATDPQDAPLIKEQLMAPGAAGAAVAGKPAPHLVPARRPVRMNRSRGCPFWA